MTKEDRIYANQKYQEIVFLLTIFNLVRNKQYIRLSEKKGYCILTYPLILFKIKDKYEMFALSYVCCLMNMILIRW